MYGSINLTVSSFVGMREMKRSRERGREGEGGRRRRRGRGGGEKWKFYAESTVCQKRGVAVRPFSPYLFSSLLFSPQ